MSIIIRFDMQKLIGCFALRAVKGSLPAGRVSLTDERRHKFLCKAKFCLVLLTIILSGALVELGAQPDKPFPPFYIRKINMGDQFTPFTLVDLDGKTWSNTSYLRKPLIIITGSWKLRHDLRKWADFLSMEYLLTADVLWVFNPCSTIFADHQKKAQQEFSRFTTSVPVAVDTHSYVGRSLQIDYDIPTIIGIDRMNRYRFSLASPFNKPGAEELKSLIRSRL